jgi:hypothetical protein
MAERNGTGFRERVQFDEPLWHELEALSAHLRLKPAEVIRMLTAVGIAQMKMLSQMPASNAALVPVVQAEMTKDFERMTGGDSRGGSGGGSSSTSGGGTGLAVRDEPSSGPSVGRAAPVVRRAAASAAPGAPEYERPGWMRGGR